MMSALRVSDLLRCILLNIPKGPNLACSREDLTYNNPPRNAALWRETLANRGDRVTLAWWDGRRLAGLASARIRSGRRAWEIDRLFLSQDSGMMSANGDEPHSAPNMVALDLFENLGVAAGDLGAERLFLRIPSNSPICVLARRAGFFPCFEEMLLKKAASDLPETTTNWRPDWRELLPEDHHSLFQLYCASTPQAVRAATGMTLDRWQDAQESRGRRKDWVAKYEGRVVGWLGLSERYGVTGVEALANPNDTEMWEALANCALSHKGDQSWLVPDYQAGLACELLPRHFHETARYSVMIKTVAVPVASQGMATVEA